MSVSSNGVSGDGLLWREIYLQRNRQVPPTAKSLKAEGVSSAHHLHHTRKKTPLCLVQVAASASPFAATENQTATTFPTKTAVKSSTGGVTSVRPYCRSPVLNAALRGKYRIADANAVEIPRQWVKKSFQSAYTSVFFD